MNITFPDGLWPVMITPLTQDGSIDYPMLDQLIDWYLAKGSNGLFATCKSSETFYMPLEERVALTRHVLTHTAKRVPVIASGHVAYSLPQQIEELQAMAATGVDAIILIANRLAHPQENEDTFLQHLDAVVSALPADMPLGFYECPYPDHRLLTPRIVQYCIDSGRFYFIKDTSCSLESMRWKLDMVRGTQIKLYNAHASTLLESLRLGASGYSSVMANYHPQAYAWLLQNWRTQPQKAELMQSALTMCSFLELKNYPVSAKYYLRYEGLPMSTVSRMETAKPLTETEQLELKQLKLLTDQLMKLAEE